MTQMTFMVLVLIGVQAWTMWELAKAREKLAQATRIMNDVLDELEGDAK